jgi:hypothetical protein
MAIGTTNLNKQGRHPGERQGPEASNQANLNVAVEKFSEFQIP